MTLTIRQFARGAAGVALAGALAVPAMAGLIPNNAVVTTGDPDTPTVLAPTLSITLGGASATDQAIGKLIQSLCVDSVAPIGQPDDLTKFRDGSAGANYQAYYCTLDAAQITGLGSNTPTLIRKRSAGGSGSGVLPVCTAFAQTFMKVDSNCTYNSNALGVSTYNCTIAAADLENVAQTDGGISDVGPGELFSEQSNACDVVKPIFGVNMSIIATTALRDALQCAQGLTVGSNTAANMPQLSKSTISSIQTGQLDNWSKVEFGGLPLTNAARLAACVPAVALPASTKTTYVRRVPTSGTFASNELRINGADNTNGECAIGNFPSKSFPGSNVTGPIIPPLASGSGNIDADMTTVNAGGAFALATCSGVDFNPLSSRPPYWTSTCPAYNAGVNIVNTNKSTWAIGHQTTERNGNNGGVPTNGYRTIAIDGVVPTLDNTAAGKYDFWVESTGQYLSSFVGASKEAVLNQLFNNAATATEVAAANALNTASIHAWGQGGIFAIKNVVACNSDTFSATTNPCVPFSRSRGGSLTPNCSEAQVLPAGNNLVSPAPQGIPAP